MLLPIRMTRAYGAPVPSQLSGPTNSSGLEKYSLADGCQGCITSQIITVVDSESTCHYRRDCLSRQLNVTESNPSTCLFSVATDPVTLADITKMLLTLDRLAIYSSLPIGALCITFQDHFVAFGDLLGYGKKSPALPGERWTAVSIQHELGPFISSNSSVLGPDDARWPLVTERYSTLGVPDVHVVLQPAVESDLQTIVRGRLPRLGPNHP